MSEPGYILQTKFCLCSDNIKIVCLWQIDSEQIIYLKDVYFNTGGSQGHLEVKLIFFRSQIVSLQNHWSTPKLKVLELGR